MHKHTLVLLNCVCVVSAFTLWYIHIQQLFGLEPNLSFVITYYLHNFM